MTKTRYDDFAKGYDPVMKPFEKKWISKWRKTSFFPLKGKILEIGIGSGANLQYYGKSAQVIGIDNSPAMLKIARKKLVASEKINTKIMRMNAAKLRFEDKSFDYVVTSLIFCSTKNPEKVMQEIHRVLKPKGKAIMLEHVVSSNKGIAFIQRAINPITKWLIDDNVAYDTRSKLIENGFLIVKEKNLGMGDVFRMFVVKKAKTRKT